MKTTIGFDIGGSSIKSVVYSGSKNIFRYSENIQKITDVFKLADKLVEILAKINKHFEIAKETPIGIAVAGIFDKNREIMLKSPNIPYLDGLNLKEIFGKYLPSNFFLENDANCFLLKEKENGIAKNLKDVFYLTLGTGIGGAILSGGKIYIGHNGAAGEAGHMLISGDNALEFEDLASEKLLKKKLNINSQKAKKMADSGDKQVLALLKTFGKNLGAGVANIVNICDPQIVIIGGGCAQLKKYLLPTVKKVLLEKAVSPQAKRIKVNFVWENSQSLFSGAEGAAIMAQTAKRNFFS